MKERAVKATSNYAMSPPNRMRHLGRYEDKVFFNQARTGDYVSLQAYLPEPPPITEALQAIRRHLRDTLGIATALGYGPRFLHSTIQFHKGGPNTGLFLQLIADETEDVSIPGVPYTFGAFLQAQALGDLEALGKHRRRVLRIHLGSGPSRIGGVVTGSGRSPRHKVEVRDQRSEDIRNFRW